MLFTLQHLEPQLQLARLVIPSLVLLLLLLLLLLLQVTLAPFPFHHLLTPTICCSHYHLNSRGIGIPQLVTHPTPTRDNKRQQERTRENKREQETTRDNKRGRGEESA
jgi:hypothetical protein